MPPATPPSSPPRSPPPFPPGAAPPPFPPAAPPRYPLDASSISTGKVLYALGSDGSCYRVMHRVRVEQMGAPSSLAASWTDALCEANWGAALTYSLGTYSASSDSYSGGDGTCNGGGGRAATVAIVEDHALANQTSVSVLEAPTCSYALTISAPPQPCVLPIGDSITEGRCELLNGECDPAKLSYLCTLQRDVLPFTARFAGPYTYARGEHVSTRHQACSTRHPARAWPMADGADGRWPTRATLPTRG